MKRFYFWFLMTPILVLAIPYWVLLLAEFIGEKAELASDKLLDLKLRQKYIAWCEKKTGYKP